MKTLIVAEKPSVAKDIAKALGGFTAHGDYLESDDLVVTSAIGHLAGLQVAEATPGAALPIIPTLFGVAPIDDEAGKRINMIGKLAKRKDISRIVNACDAGREGELIFWYLFECIGVEKPRFRMWMQSMTEGAIKKAFADIIPAADKARLLDAARSRAEADWLVGINGSRAFTNLLRMGTGQRINVSIGRVQTPTLALIAHRELVIRHFVARDYFEIHATFDVASGQYVGRWLRQEPGLDEDGKHRIGSADAARELVSQCVGGKGIAVSEETKPSKKSPGSLFDLTSLQREANNRFGFTAKQTLDIAQALYEKHKATTYPRTDSCYLPDDYPRKTEEVMATLRGVECYSPFAAAVLANGWISNSKIFDGSKVSDHFAIIPTGQVPSGLSDGESKIYDLVVRRFLAVFYPPAHYLQTIRITTVGAEKFLSAGKVLTEAGWLEVYGREVPSQGAEVEADLCALADGEVPRLVKVETKAKKTTAPKRFTEATLLTAMEKASGDIEDDDDAKQAMGDKGLGTPATRAATIEGMISKENAYREGKQIIPSERGLQLILQLERLSLGLLTAPKLTGEWEYGLSRIEKGEVLRDAFMADIAAFTCDVVRRFADEQKKLKPNQVEHPCPDCGFPLFRSASKFKKGEYYWSCSNYPTCKTICADLQGKPGARKQEKAVSTEHLCPRCGKGLVFRRGVGKKGPWKMWGCSGYPSCDGKFDDKGGKPVFQVSAAEGGEV